MDEGNRALAEEKIKEKYEILRILGQGAFGTVRLVRNKETDESFAMKTIQTNSAEDSVTEPNQEILLSQNEMMTHPNIVTFYGSLEFFGWGFIFMEEMYGTLNEKLNAIEKGMPQTEAQRCFLQLLCGVEYLHSKGLAHRDLKPANILISSCMDCIKIADFGCATFFCSDGQEIYLSGRIGTTMYMAPEIFPPQQPYQAQPVDVWACGITLFEMLIGDDPWSKATISCDNYKIWKTEAPEEHTSWLSLDKEALSLLRAILTETVTKRASLASIKDHPWFQRSFQEENSGQVLLNHQRLNSAQSQQTSGHQRFKIHDDNDFLSEESESSESSSSSSSRDLLPVCQAPVLPINESARPVLPPSVNKKKRKGRDGSGTWNPLSGLDEAQPGKEIQSKRRCLQLTEDKENFNPN